MLEMLRAAKGGQTDGERVGRNVIAARSCMVQEGTGEQVKGSKAASAGTGGGGRREWTLVLPGNPIPEEKGVNREQKEWC